jgi:UDP-glucose 4-epimerase
MHEMATFLITGGAGFIGSHLAEALLKRGDHVLALDDLSAGSVNNLAHLRSYARFEFVPETVSAPYVLAELVDVADVIFHLAATVGVLNIIQSPVTTIVNNIAGTEAVLKAAAKKRKKVIIASTSEVYGKSTAVPFRELDDLVLGTTSKARWSYAASKVVDECLGLAYWRAYQVPTVIVRLFNTIGPRQVGRYGMVVPRFMAQALQGQNLTVYGHGQQSRCFTYVSDVIAWILLLTSIDKAVGEIINLGNPREVTITELARMIIAVTGAHVDIDYIPYEKAYEEGFEDMERRVPDIAKVKTLTGYSPRIELEQALCLIHDWFVNEKIVEQPLAFGYAAMLPQEERA